MLCGGINLLMSNVRIRCTGSRPSQSQGITLMSMSAPQSNLTTADYVCLSVPRSNPFGGFGALIPFHPLVELIGYRDIPTSRKLRVPTFDGSIELDDLDNVILMFAGLLIATI